MSYALDANESVRDGLRRCAGEQLDSAVQALEQEIRQDPAKAIHTARKALKKERSLLRLARRPLPREVRRAENRGFAEVGRALSGLRDAEVVGATYDRIISEDGVVAPRSRGPLRGKLTSAFDGEVSEQTVGEAAETLRAARARVEQWPLTERGWKALAPGVERSARRARRAMRDAEKKPTPERLHGWRKRVKDLWYHLRLVGDVCGPAVQGQAKDAGRLADLLGEEHDLAVLREVLAQQGETTAAARALAEAVEERREHLRREAFALGARVHAEKPKALRRRLGRLWKTGRVAARTLADDGAPAAPEAHPAVVV